MADAHDDRHPVELLAEEFTARLRGGEHPSVTEYVEKYPQWAGQIRELLPAAAVMEQLRSSETASRRAAQFPARAPEIAERIGDYRILREIGRGGMGVVYEAEQHSLKRRVALKVLSTSTASSPHHLKRFRREARAAARLHHTNIVPVFGIGEQEGLHYYVMQLIDGVGLDEVLSELSRQLEGHEGKGKAEPGSLLPNADSAASAAMMAADALRDGIFARGRKGVHSSTSWSDSAILLPIPGRLLDAAAPDTGCPSASTAAGGPSADGRSPLPDRRPAPDPPVTGEFSAAGGNGLAAGNDTPPLAEHAARASAARREGKLGQRYWSSVARIGVQLADALQYAHRQGVLHRDIKPANVLLDRQGVVWITDFGLATHEDYDAVTRSGDIVGTLRYMAPEQLNGQTDARSDIYSLGLTLYELLTLRPAFRDGKHGPLLRQKAAGIPLPPRAVNPGIPRDLETITLKACATDPAHRYQTAGELEMDLQRYLDDRPIMARRVPPLERLWRWGRRNPLVAALSSISLLLLLSVAIVSAIGNYRTARALARVDDERQKALQAAAETRQEHARAEANLRLAVRAFEQIIGNVANRGIPQSMEWQVADEEEPLPPAYDAVVTAADAQLLQTLLGFFNEFALRNRADLKLETATANRCIGDIHHRLGQMQEAERGYRDALGCYRAVAQQDPQNPRHTLAITETLNELAIVYSKQGDGRRAFETHMQARRELERRPEILSTPDGKYELARTLNLLNSIGGRTGTGNMMEAMRAKPHEGPLRPGWTPARPAAPAPGAVSERAKGGGSRPDARRPESAEGARRRGGAWTGPEAPRPLDLLRELVDQDPGNVKYQLALVDCYRNRARLLWAPADAAEAKQSLADAIGILERLAGNAPNDPRVQYALADTLSLTVPSFQETSEVLQDRLQRAVAICRQLVSVYPSIPEYQALLASSLKRMAALQIEAGRLDEAEQSFRKAISYEQSLVERFASVSLYRVAYSQSLLGLADLERERNRLPASRQHLETAIRDLENYVSSTKDNFFHRRFLGALYNSLSATLTLSGEKELAAEARHKARAMGQFGPPPTPRGFHWPPFWRRDPRGATDRMPATRVENPQGPP